MHLRYDGPIDRASGVLDLLRAVAALRARGVALGVRVTVCGDGPDERVARNLRRRLGLHRVVGFAPSGAVPPHASDVDVTALVNAYAGDPAGLAAALPLR